MRKYYIEPKVKFRNVKVRLMQQGSPNVRIGFTTDQGTSSLTPQSEDEVESDSKFGFIDWE